MISPVLWLISHMLERRRRKKKKNTAKQNKQLQHIIILFISKVTYILQKALSWQPEETNNSKTICVFN